MANITLVSTNLPKFVAEIARQYMIAERALTTPEANVTMGYGESLITINGSLVATASIDTATANVVTIFTNSTPDFTPILTGTPLADLTVDNLAEALFAAVVRLDAQEAAKLTTDAGLPAGVGSSFSIANGLATFTAVLPYAVSLDASGNQVLSVSNYLA